MKKKIPLVELKNSNLRESEEGAVLLEWAIVAGGLFLGLLIAFDVARAINSYMLLTQAAYEGVRYASTIPELEDVGRVTDLTPTEAEVSACSSNSSTAFACKHYLLQQRTTRAINNLNTFSSGGIGNDISISTELVPRTSGTDANNTVFVSVRSTFNGTLLPSIPIQVEHQMSYLYETA